MGHYERAYSLLQAKIDYQAYTIEQHEVGFSDNEKIGTDNVRDCVALILHDPISKKSALAHIDRGTDYSSISNVIDHFQNIEQLDAYLIGGQHFEPSPQKLSRYEDDIKNQHKISKELQMNCKNILLLILNQLT